MKPTFAKPAHGFVRARMGLRGFVPLSFVLWIGLTLSEGAIPATITPRNFFDPLLFDRPLLVLDVPGRDSAYLVVQQSGGMQVVRRLSGAWTKARFDSISVGGVNGTSGDDGGLLGFAFHPQYITNGKYYVFYVASYTVRARPGRIYFEERVADFTRLKGSGGTPRLLLNLDKPYIYHNGGTLKFGGDGYLYTAIGDGGFPAAEGDPDNRAQNKLLLWGKMLRLDVDGADAFPEDATRNYAIPPDNPFVGNPAYLPEIWAIGLRSPWKWSFHPRNGSIWLGDIGHNTYEDLSVVPKGGNMGWKVWEAKHCYSPASDCLNENMVVPVLETTTPQGSITGGVFYRGAGQDTTALFHGLYFFGDYVSHKVWALRENNGVLVEYSPVATINKVVSIDKDARGHILATSISAGSNLAAANGTVFILESPDMPPQNPVRIAMPPAERPKALPFAEFLRNRDSYRILGLDGREVSDIPSGAFIIREKDGSAPPRMVTGIR